MAVYSIMDNHYSKCFAIGISCILYQRNGLLYIRNYKNIFGEEGYSQVVLNTKIKGILGRNYNNEDGNTDYGRTFYNSNFIAEKCYRNEKEFEVKTTNDYDCKSYLIENAVRANGFIPANTMYYSYNGMYLPEYAVLTNVEPLQVVDLHNANEKVADWYLKKYQKNNVWDCLNKEITFNQLYDKMMNGFDMVSTLTDGTLDFDFKTRNIFIDRLAVVTRHEMWYIKELIESGFEKGNKIEKTDIRTGFLQ